MSSIPCMMGAPDYSCGGDLSESRRRVDHLVVRSGPSGEMNRLKELLTMPLKSFKPAKWIKDETSELLVKSRENLALDPSMVTLNMIPVCSKMAPFLLLTA